MLSTDLPTLRTVTSSLLPGVTGTGNAVILQGCLPMVASSLLPGEGGGHWHWECTWVGPFRSPSVPAEAEASLSPACPAQGLRTEGGVCHRPDKPAFCVLQETEIMRAFTIGTPSASPQKQLRAREGETSWARRTPRAPSDPLSPHSS